MKIPDSNEGRIARWLQGESLVKFATDTAFEG
jgi:hypothetical protein